MKYRLNIQCRIQETQDSGAWNGQGLSTEYIGVVSAASFLEVAKILGQFHDLAEQLNEGATDERG